MSELHEIVRKARNLAPSTRKQYLKDLDIWIRFAGGKPSDWTRSRAQAFYDHLLDERELRPQSATRLFASLRFASKWWAHFQNNKDLDFAHVQLAQAEAGDKRRALEPAEVAKLLEPLLKRDCPAALRDLAIVVTMLETGMRRMSLVSMTIERTLIDDDRLQETRTPSPLAWVNMKGKGKADVPVPLSDTAIHTIRPWRQWLAVRGITKGPLFRGLHEQIGPQGSMIVRAAKHALGVDAINKMLDRRTAAAGIGHLYPHLFRHTFVSWRLAAGMQPHEVAIFTGHSVKSIGEMQGYIDERVIAPKIRNSTPEWLKVLVTR